MEVFFCLLLLGSSVAELFQGDRLEQHNRSYKKVEKFFDQVEEFSDVVSVKKESLGKHAASLRRLADEIHKVHGKATKDKAIGAGIAVGGGLITATGIALEVCKKASPLTSIAGEAISLLGSYYQSTSWSKEQEEEMKQVNLANTILQRCERDLQELSDQYLIIRSIFMFLEEEEELHGTVLYEKLTEMKSRFPHFLPTKRERSHVDLNGQLVRFAVTAAKQSGLIRLTEDKFFGSSKELPNDASKPIKGGDLKAGTPLSTKVRQTSRGIEVKGGDLKEGTPLSTKVRQTSRVIQVAQAASTAHFLYQNSKELYNELTHLNEGARSELAENMRDVATHIEDVIQSLSPFLPK